MTNVGAVSLRYQAQTWAYTLLLHRAIRTRRRRSRTATVESTETRSWRRDPPGPRGRLTLRPALVLAAGRWAVAAYLLLRTTVPGSLHLPHIDVGATFGAAHAERAARYERFFRWDWVLSQVALLVVLAVYARTGVRFVRQSAAGRIGTGMLLGMLGLALVWLSQLPFGIAQHWWDRRYGLRPRATSRGRSRTGASSAPSSSPSASRC